mmetsp:Transcript_833/g.2299  ORF Transcript_833/g.2299 Transcript_833/m.2299 type:complete len:252 (+) Transcript_833:723-1478(+)
MLVQGPPVGNEVVDVDKQKGDGQAEEEGHFHALSKSEAPRNLDPIPVGCAREHQDGCTCQRGADHVPQPHQQPSHSVVALPDDTEGHTVLQTDERALIVLCLVPARNGDKRKAAGHHVWLWCKAFGCHRQKTLGTQADLLDEHLAPLKAAEQCFHVLRSGGVDAAHSLDRVMAAEEPHEMLGGAIVCIIWVARPTLVHEAERVNVAISRAAQCNTSQFAGCRQRPAPDIAYTMGFTVLVAESVLGNVKDGR